MTVYYLKCSHGGELEVRAVTGSHQAPHAGEVGPINATGAAHALRIAEHIFEAYRTPDQKQRRTSSVAKLMRQHREMTTAQLSARFGLSEQRVREITRRR